MSFKRFGCARAALATSSALYLLASAQVVVAQETSAEDEADAAATIVVTGSRIARRDYEASSPIVSVGEDLLKNTGTSAVESALNKLPAFTPVQTPSNGTDIQATATNTPGAATVSLRGLGTNRNLVLIDGRRAVPANALGVVDINTIPAAAIERVEIITGGASATYGADAVAGVVNFILKDDFQGLALDGNVGVTSRGDGFEYTISGLMGANFDDGRGNITIGLSTNQRDETMQREREWFTDVWQDPRFTATNFFPIFSGFQPFGGINPTQASYDAIFGAGVVNTGANRIYFNEDGTAFTGFRNSPAGGAFRFNGPLDTIRWKELADGTLGQNFTNAYSTLPLTRYNIYANGKYEINEWINLFAQANFTRASARTVNDPSPVVNGWSALVPAANDVPAELRSILDSRVIPVGTSAATLSTLNCDPAAVPGAPGSGASCDWQLAYNLDFADREARTDVSTYNMLAGFNGDIPGTDWTYEVFASRGESTTSALTTGIASLERVRAILAAPDWGAGFSAQGNPLFGGFGAAQATCTSGLNPWDLDQEISRGLHRRHQRKSSEPCDDGPIRRRTELAGQRVRTSGWRGQRGSGRQLSSEQIRVFERYADHSGYIVPGSGSGHLSRRQLRRHDQRQGSLWRTARSRVRWF